MIDLKNFGLGLGILMAAIVSDASIGNTMNYRISQVSGDCATAGAELTFDQDQVKVQFKQFEALVGRSSGTRYSKVNCLLDVEAQIPKGYALKLMNVHTESANKLPMGAGANLALTLRAQGSEREILINQVFKGPTDRKVLAEATPDSALLSDCSGKVKIEMKAEISNFSNMRLDPSSTSLTDSQVSYKYQLIKCSQNIASL